MSAAASGGAGGAIAEDELLLQRLAALAAELRGYIGATGIIGEPASDPVIGGWVRGAIYDLVQAQTRQDEGVIFDELKCTICTNFYDADGHAPITVRCGHTVCDACWTASLARRLECPMCRASVARPLPGPTTHIIVATNRLRPIPGAGPSVASSHPTPLVRSIAAAAAALRSFAAGEGASDRTYGPRIRQAILQIIQAQSRSFIGACFNDLKCSTCTQLLSKSNIHAAREKDAVTLPCGHSSCRGCLRSRLASGTPFCRDCVGVVSPITGPILALGPTVCISDLVDVLTRAPAAPAAAATAGDEDPTSAGGRRKGQRKTKRRNRTRSTRKYKQRRRL